MKTKDLKINFRYLGGNIACLSVDSIDGESVHNDINNEEAIIIFNSIVGEKENCQTVKKLLQENQELKEKLDKYENPKDMTLFAMWCTEKVKDENEKLKEEITNLSKEIDMWNSKYNDMFDENRELKKQLEERPKEYVFIGNAQNKTRDFINQITKDNKEFKNQQKEFIKYMNKTIEELECDDVDDEEIKGYLIQRIDTFKGILSEYKEIIGVSNENNL